MDTARKNPNNQRRDRGRAEAKEFVEQVLQIKRVSKKTQGGNNISFTALVVIGDKKGRVGVGLRRGLEVPQAIRKAILFAKKQMITVPLNGTTIPHSVVVSYGAAKVMLKPAPEGTGLKVGSVVRTILSIAGIENASGKIIGSRNHTTNAYAVVKGLKMLKKKA